jgi:predicted peroxiredoxin
MEATSKKGMEEFMLKSLLAACFIMMGLFAGCNTTDSDTTGKAPRDGILVHIAAGPDNPHRVLMALQMAARMSEDKDVAVYLDIEAVRLFVRGATDIEMEPFPSALSQLSALAEKGVPIMACPGCLAVAGIAPDSLMDGVTIAEKEKFFDFSDGRIITLDY